MDIYLLDLLEVGWVAHLLSSHILPINHTIAFDQVYRYYLLECHIAMNVKLNIFHLFEYFIDFSNTSATKRWLFLPCWCTNTNFGNKENWVKSLSRGEQYGKIASERLCLSNRQRIDKAQRNIMDKRITCRDWNQFHRCENCCVRWKF